MHTIILPYYHTTILSYYHTTILSQYCPAVVYIIQFQIIYIIIHSHPQETMRRRNSALPGEEGEESALCCHNQQQKYHINKFIKNSTKYHYRIFMGRLKSFLYQKLVNDINQKPKRVDNSGQEQWPYQFLYNKKFKTEHQLLEIQFVNMCAEKIQSIFKGYLIRKIHTIALSKLKKFTQRAVGLVRGWKVRRVFRCFKQKDLTSIKSKRQEISAQLGSIQNSSTKYNAKRLQYLKSSLRDELFHFHRKFKDLYDNGMWVFQATIVQKTEPLQLFKRWKKVQNIRPMKENTFVQEQLHQHQFMVNRQQTKSTRQQVVKPKRVREMKSSQQNRKNNSNVMAEQSLQPQNIAKAQNKSAFQTNTTSIHQMQDRPIMAKGSYSYNFNEEIHQQPQTYTQPEKPEQINNQEQGQKEDTNKSELRKREKKKLQKRQFYDPKKAIQQQKKRKQQQVLRLTAQAIKQCESPQLVQTKSSANIVEKPLKSKNNDLKSQKSLRATEKEQIRSTVHIPKIKEKAEAKIDCWGNRKTVVKKTEGYGNKQNKVVYNITLQSFKEKGERKHDLTEKEQAEQVKSLSPIDPKRIKSQVIPAEQPRSPNRQETKMLTHEALLKKIAEKRQKQKQKYEYSEERVKKMVQMQKNREQVENIKRNLQRNRNQNFNNQNRRHQEEARQRMSSYASQTGTSGVQNRQRVLVDEQKRKQMAKQIQQLEQAYNVQYKNRLQILFPKLGLLSAAREKQKRSSIAVVTSDDPLVQRGLLQTTSQQVFWQKVTKMQKQFKQNVQCDQQ